MVFFEGKFLDGFLLTVKMTAPGTIGYGSKTKQSHSQMIIEEKLQYEQLSIFHWVFNAIS